jgi:hypothetical protein
MKRFCSLSIALAAFTLPALAVTIQYGNTFLGVNPHGHLNDVSGAPSPFPYIVGLTRAGVGDATSPGCLCEGWGVSASLSGSSFSGGANEAANGGPFGLSPVVFNAATASSFTSRVTLTGGPLQVEHFYFPSPVPDVFQAQVRISNLSPLNTLDDVVYRRVMDWDVPPTEFNEYVSHYGVTAHLEANGGRVRFASNNGFASADPLSGPSWLNPSSVNTDFIDLGPADHGSLFDFALGPLAPGATHVFNIFYGTAPNEVTALQAANLLGMEVYSLGQNSATDPAIGEPATFLFGFNGVGTVEPGDSPTFPIFVDPTDGVFVFVEPRPRRWYDPPFADGFMYELLGGAKFTTFGAPPAPPFNPSTVSIYDSSNNLLGTVAPGGMFDLSPYNLSKFYIKGIAPLLDIASPGFAVSYPAFLDWTGVATSLIISPILAAPIPEPETVSLVLAAGIVALGVYKRRRAS